MGYYVLEAGKGTLVTPNICETEAAVATANAMATNWIKQFLTSKILSQEKLSRVFVEVKDTLQGPFHEGISLSAEDNQSSQLLSVEEVCGVLAGT